MFLLWPEGFASVLETLRDATASRVEVARTELQCGHALVASHHYSHDDRRQSRYAYMNARQFDKL
jgi:hypothetical protein